MSPSLRALHALVPDAICEGGWGGGKAGGASGGGAAAVTGTAFPPPPPPSPEQVQVVIPRRVHVCKTGREEVPFKYLCWFCYRTQLPRDVVFIGDDEGPAAEHDAD